MFIHCNSQVFEQNSVIAPFVMLAHEVEFLVILLRFRIAYRRIQLLCEGLRRAPWDVLHLCYGPMLQNYEFTLDHVFPTKKWL